MPPYLFSRTDFAGFLHRFSTAQLTRAEWNHAAHLAIAAATLHGGGSAADVRARILALNEKLGIVSTPQSGYHETITRFWVERIRQLIAGLGRGASEWDAARAVVAAFAHRGRLFDAYYSYDVVANIEARAVYHPPDLPDPA